MPICDTATKCHCAVKFLVHAAIAERTPNLQHKHMTLTLLSDPIPLFLIVYHIGIICPSTLTPSTEASWRSLWVRYNTFPGQKAQAIHQTTRASLLLVCPSHFAWWVWWRWRLCNMLCWDKNHPKHRGPQSAYCIIQNIAQEHAWILFLKFNEQVKVRPIHSSCMHP